MPLHALKPHGCSASGQGLPRTAPHSFVLGQSEIQCEYGKIWKMHLHGSWFLTSGQLWKLIEGRKLVEPNHWPVYVQCSHHWFWCFVVGSFADGSQLHQWCAKDPKQQSTGQTGPPERYFCRWAACWHSGAARRGEAGARWDCDSGREWKREKWYKTLQIRIGPLGIACIALLAPDFLFADCQLATTCALASARGSTV